MSRFIGRKWERYTKVWEARQTGKTYRELGKEFGVCGQRCREMCLKYEKELNRPVEWWEGLTPRVHNALMCDGYASRESVASAKYYDLLKIPNFGMKSLSDVEEWLKT